MSTFKNDVVAMVDKARIDANAHRIDSPSWQELIEVFRRFAGLVEERYRADKINKPVLTEWKHRPELQASEGTCRTVSEIAGWYAARAWPDGTWEVWSENGARVADGVENDLASAEKAADVYIRGTAGLPFRLPDNTSTVDENGLGPDGTCPDCACASATDHSNYCPNKKKVVSNRDLTKAEIKECAKAAYEIKAADTLAEGHTPVPWEWVCEVWESFAICVIGKGSISDDIDKAILDRAAEIRKARP